MEAKKILHNSFEFHNNCNYNMTKYYRCMHFESKGCTARLIVSENKVKEKGVHNCIPQQEHLQVKATEYVKRYIKTQALDLSKNPDEIYRLLLQDLASEYSLTAITIPSKKQISNQILYKRSNETNHLHYEFVEIRPHSLTNLNMPFFKKHIYGDFNKQFHIMLIWTLDEGLVVLRHQEPIFVDGTFRCVPAAFAQYIIIMAWDAASQLFVPCVWALVTGKSEYFYCEFIHNVFILLNYNWMPCCCIVDFEIGLLNSVKYQFTESIIAGCYFHFQQALLRKMKKFQMPKLECEECSKIIYILTIVPINEINIAIKFIQTNEELKHENWPKFWNYFQKTWIDKHKHSLWNISNINERNLQGRKNNCLERYNRYLNELFSNAHPNLVAFITVIKNNEEYYSNMMKSIRSGSMELPKTKKEFTKQTLPINYINFKSE